MTRVLFISSTLKRTGPTNILYNLIAALDRSKFEPIILTLSEEDSRFPSLWSSFEDLNVKIFSFKFSRLKGFFEGKKKIKKFIETQNINVVHIYGFRGDILVNSNVSEKVKVVSTINSNIFDDYTMLYGKYVGKIMAYLHIKSLKGKISIACSRFVADELNKRYNIDLKVIYNGIPCNDYTVTLPNERDSLRKELLLPLEKKIFIFVGYLIYRKDPITVIRAFLNSKAAENSILLMIGDGPLMEDCKKHSDGKEENIMFLGNQPSTINFLKASDFYISSAYSEGLPTSVMEAMGCGLPVILSGIRPHEELVSNINNWNYLFPVNEYKILSTKIDEIIYDDYDLLSNSCRSVIFNDINSNKMTSNYQLLYETQK
jgi:glycosyltransferase involved in cell wall biosynthesis